MILYCDTGLHKFSWKLAVKTNVVLAVAILILDGEHQKINFGIIFVNIVTVKSWNRAAEFGRRTKLGQNNYKLLEVVIQKQLKTSFG